MKSARRVREQLKLMTISSKGLQVLAAKTVVPEVAEVCLAHLAHWKVQVLDWP